MKLPELLREIEGVAGREAALALAGRYGGRRVQIPRRARAGHALADLVGPAALAKLVQRYGGCRLYIAKAPAVARAYRNAAIAARRAAGETVDALAQEYCLSERQVWSILRPARSRKASRAA